MKSRTVRETVYPGRQGLNFAFLGRVAHYHTSEDNLENLDLRSL